MQMTLIKNSRPELVTIYKLARAVYAETNAATLSEVEALSSMIGNVCVSSMRNLADIANDNNIFESLNKNSARHPLLYINSDAPGFQMCLRCVKKMVSGFLPDSVMGAVKFHRAENMPDWATSTGYIAEVGNLFFYL